MKFLTIILFSLVLFSTNLLYAKETQKEKSASVQPGNMIADSQPEQTVKIPSTTEFMLENPDANEKSTAEPDASAASAEKKTTPAEKALLQASVKPQETLLAHPENTPTEQTANKDVWDVVDFEHGLQLFSGKQPAPPLALTDMDGKAHDLQEYLGKIVLLNFWQTDCPSCVKEIASLENLQKKFSTDDFVVLSVDMGEDEETVATFLDNFPVTYPVMLDPGNSVLQAWKLLAYPTTFLIDREGYLRLFYFGGLEWDEEEIVNTLATELEMAAN